MNKGINKRKAIWSISIILVVVFISILVIIYIKYPKYSKEKEFVREYIIGEPGIKGAVNQSNFGDDPAYEIGADKDGYAVFKNPDKAFTQMKIDYAKGIAAIKKEYGLRQLSRWNYSLYGTYGWQLRKTEDKEAYDQGFRISKFFDIYENSFE